MFKATEPIQTKFEIVFDWLILTMSFIFIVLGVGGLLMVITSYRYESDVLLEYAYTFVYSYMLILGIILIAYRKKIIVKK